MPIQTSVTTAKRRNCNRANTFLANDADEILKAFFDPFDFSFDSPMCFSREIDDPARPKECLVFRHEHLPSAHLARLARARIGFEVVRELLLEH